jgi:hypothetical protein
LSVLPLHYSKYALIQPWTIDVKTEKKLGDLRGDIGAIRYVLAHSFRKSRPSPPKNERFSQEMNLKIPFLSRGLKLSNSKPGCRVSTLHFFVKWIPPTAF